MVRLTAPYLIGSSLLIVLTLLLTKAVMSQTGTSLTLVEYHQQIQESIALLEEIREPDEQSQLQTVQEKLAAITSVQYPSGEVVSMKPLLEDTLSVDEALMRLKLIDTQLDAAINDNSATRLAQLTTVFDRAEFNIPETLWQRFRRWVNEWLESILPERSPNEINAGTMGLIGTILVWLVAALGAILTAFLLSYWLQGLFGNFVSEAERKRREQAGEAAPLTATSARKQATAFAQTGEYRQAVRQLYLSALLALEEKDLLHYDRTLTNREVLTQIKTDEPLKQHLQPIVETFDDVWYGIQEPDAQTFSAYQDEIDLLSDVAAPDQSKGKAQGGAR